MPTKARYLTIALLVSVLVGLVPQSPANASHGVDLANAAPTGWTANIIATGPSGGNDTCPTSLACDANDATGRRIDHFAEQASLPGHGTNLWYMVGGISFTRTSGVTTFDISSMRVVWETCASGAGSSCGGAQLTMTSLTVTEFVAGTCSSGSEEFHYQTQTANAEFDSGELDFSVGPATIANNGGLCFWLETTQSNIACACYLTVSVIEVYGEGTVLPTIFGDYVYGLRLDHMWFERVITFFWKQTWDGVWSVSDVDDDVLGGGISGGTVGARIQVSIPCVPICGDDTYTIHVHPDGHEEATYEIDSDESGELIPKISTPIVNSIYACLNVTDDQCAAPYEDDAGTLVVHWSYVCSDLGAGPGGTCDPTDVLIGYAAYFGSAICVSCSGVGGEAVAGVIYESSFGWDAADGDIAIVRVENEFNEFYFHTRTFQFTVSGGVIGGVVVPVGGSGDPLDGDDDCGPVPLGCVIGGILEGLFVPCGMGSREFDDCEGQPFGAGSVANRFNSINSREPFASVIGAFTLVGEVLNTEDDITDDAYCEEYTVEFDLPVGFTAGAGWPASNEFDEWQFVPAVWDIKLCLETIGGTTDYQNLFRPLMGGMVYLTWIFGAIRHYSPKPRLTA